MGKEILTFGNVQIEKNKFYPIGLLFFWELQILKKYQCVTNFFGEKNKKYFIGYLYNGNKVKLLDIILPKISTYVKSCDGQTKRIYFFIQNDELLEKYNTI